jgi:hypothetical protein
MDVGPGPGSEALRVMSIFLIANSAAGRMQSGSISVEQWKTSIARLELQSSDLFA